MSILSKNLNPIAALVFGTVERTVGARDGVFKRNIAALQCGGANTGTDGNHLAIESNRMLRRYSGVVFPSPIVQSLILSVGKVKTLHLQNGQSDPVSDTLRQLAAKQRNTSSPAAWP